MPWEKRTEMEQREAFVTEANRNQMSFAALCRSYGISRKTGYKWVARSAQGKMLCDQSRRPKHTSNKTPEPIEQLVVAVRQANPAWGGKTIKKVLENAGYTNIPSSKTCSAILKRNGCIAPEESLKHTPYCRFQREKCNQLWQMDFKGDFLLGNGSRCYPLDIIDDHSRFCLLIDAKPAAKDVESSLIRVFEEYGLPDAILTDNGAQFAGFRGGYTKVERLLMDLDILPIHGRIMHPQTQGKIERFHRTMKQEALRVTPEDIETAQLLLQNWRWKYNQIRPHSALQMKTPADIYVPSDRPFFKPKPYEYDSDARMVKVNNWGYLRFGPVEVYLSETMKNTYLQIRPNVHDCFDVLYRNYKIACVDASTNKLINRHIRKL